MRPAFLPLIILGLSIVGCENQTSKTDTRLFQLLDKETTGVDFVNTVSNQGNMNIFKYRNFYNGGGVAIGDVNNDGLPDLYLTANQGNNKLYLNKGNLRFEDITSAAGVGGNKPWSTGVVMVDINADGLLDIYVSNAGNLEGDNHDNDLYINNGDLTFREEASTYNLAKSGFTTQASFFDYDRDGDLDAYILNNSNIPVSSLGYAHQRDVRAQDWEEVPHIFRGVGDMLLRNDNERFVDVSEQAGIYGSLIGFGLGVMVSDINKDQWPDIYVSNDFYERDYLYINNRDGTFSEQIKEWTQHLCLSAMGVDIADINNDGLSDIFVTDMLPEKDKRINSVMEFEGYTVFKLKQSRDFHQQYIHNTLQINNGDNTFSEIANYSGIARTDWSWAGLIFDMDNDGRKDIFVTNGINHDLTDLDFVDFFANNIVQELVLKGVKQSVDSIIDKMPQTPLPNYAYRNIENFKFENYSSKWGFDKPSYSNGVAYGDLDNDGDLDLVINNVNMEAFVYENKSSQLTNNHYLKLSLEGDSKNKKGIGTKIYAYHDDRIWHQEQMPSRGFQSSMDYNLIFGFGEVVQLDSLEVIWPDQRRQILYHVGLDTSLLLSYDDSKEFQIDRRAKSQTLLSSIVDSGLPLHIENTDYWDFDYEPLVSSKLSQEGPAVAVSDVDGDGNLDIFIGGAKGSSSAIYRHLGNGKFEKYGSAILEKDDFFEDVASCFVDVDGDGDDDLFVGSGGNERGEEQYCGVRLYMNVEGQFERTSTVFKTIGQNIAVIESCDYDEDGDMDLFVGSRSQVSNYGRMPKHLLLINDGNGRFSDQVGNIKLDNTSDLGMITDAVWGDINGDLKIDLVTVADWGTPLIFINQGDGTLKESSFLKSETLYGWWKAVHLADLDGDGDNDIVLGNEGQNMPYIPTCDAPIKLWVNDFDNNGSFEQIMTIGERGLDFPLHMKKELTSQIVSLKKENLKAHDYAHRPIDQLFDDNVLDKTKVYTCTNSASYIAWNNGNGDFDLSELPYRGQWSCVHAINTHDFDQDGYMDIMIAGNDFETKPQFSRQDGMNGSIFINSGDRLFEWKAYTESGLSVKQEVKHIAELVDNEGTTYFVILVNNGKPLVYKTNISN